MNKSNPDIISVNNVSKSFAKTIAVEQVSINIKEGEIVGLLGPNGAGKTTLINLMLGRLTLIRGTISINGYSPGSIKARQHIGAILQSTEIPGTLKVTEHIELFSSYYPNPLPIEQVLGVAQLTDLANRRFDTLSGGQKQRVFFALAICGQPKVVFLDEPTVGLDTNSRRKFWQCLRALATNGTSILLTTHYLDEADALSDRIYLLNQGKITHQGTPESLKAAIGGKKIRFKSDQDIALFRQLPDVEQLDQVNEYIELQTRQTEKTLRELLSLPANISDITVKQSSLEDAFINLTQESSDSLNRVTTSQSEVA